MKQLTKLQREEQSLSAKLRNMTVRPRRRRNANRSNGGVTYTEIPMEVAYTVRQPTTKQIHRESACEYIGDFVILPNSVPGTSQKYMMNPINLATSRLRNLARNYQKYRFTKLALKVQSSTTTSTNGLYIVGYNSNPDAEYTLSTAIPSVFNLPGAQSANVWRTTTSVAKIEDRNKWYNIDPDSEEIMQTTQGYFAIVVQSPTSATGPLSMPVLLEYTIEFTGSAWNVENTSNAPIAYPAGRWTYNGTTGNWTFTAAAGEIPTPSIASGEAYIVNPVYPVKLSTGVEDIIGVVQGTTLSWRFYRDVEDLALGTVINGVQDFDSNRTTWTKILN